ncbi:hypothetical protein L6R29_16585 [Myxococcota bacterium]|nr:hypothetical protein [Myxococcota bacterium]
MLRACERLIQQGALQEGSFLAARAIQDVNGEDLGLILERMGGVSSETLQMTLAERWGCRFLSDEQVMLLWEEAAIQPPRQVALAWMRQGRFVPLRFANGSLSLLVWRPLSEATQMRLCEAVGCAHLEYILISSYALGALLERLEPGKEEMSITSGELDVIVPAEQSLGSTERPVGLQIGSSLGMGSSSLTQGLPVVRTISSDDLLPSAKEPTMLDSLDHNAKEGASQSLSDLIAAPEDLSGDALPRASGGSGDALPRTAGGSGDALPRTAGGSGDALPRTAGGSGDALPRTAGGSGDAFPLGLGMEVPNAAAPFNTKQQSDSSERLGSAASSSDKRTIPPPSFSSPAAEKSPHQLLVTNPMSLVSPGPLATMSLDTISGRKKSPLDPMTFLEEMALPAAPTSSARILSSAASQITQRTEPKTSQSSELLSASSIRSRSESGDVAFFGAATPRGVLMQGAKQKSGGALVIGGLERSTLGGIPTLSSASAPIDPLALLPKADPSERSKEASAFFDEAVNSAVAGREQAQAWLSSEQVAVSSDALEAIGSKGEIRKQPVGSVYTPESLDSLEASRPYKNTNAQADATEAPTSADLIWASQIKPMFVEEEPTSVDNEPLFPQEAKRRAAQKDTNTQPPQIPHPSTQSATDETLDPHRNAQSVTHETPASHRIKLSEAADDPKPLMRTGRDYRTLPVGVVPSLIRSLEQEEPSFALFERDPRGAETARAKLPSRARHAEKEEPSAPSSQASPSGKLESSEAIEPRPRIPSSSALKPVPSRTNVLLLRIGMALGIVVVLSLGLWYFLLRNQSENAYNTDEPSTKRSSQETPPNVDPSPPNSTRTSVPTRSAVALPPAQRLPAQASPRKKPEEAHPTPTLPREEQESLWRWDPQQGKLVPKRPEPR